MITNTCDRQRAAALKWAGLPPGIPPKLVKEFDRLIHDGKTVKDLTTATSIFFLVPNTRFKKHCDLNPDWSANIRKMSDANASKKKVFTNGKRLKTEKMCLKGLHPMKGHNLINRLDGRRRCRACSYIAQHGPPMTAALMERVKKALDANLSLNQILNGKPMAGGPVDRSLVITTPAKFNNQRKIDPEFARLVEKHIEPAHAVANAMRCARERGVPSELIPMVITVARLKYKLRSIR